MDDKTIFQNGNQAVVNNQPQIQAVQKEPALSPEQVQPQAVNGDDYYEESEGSGFFSSFPIASVLKGIIGIIFLLAVVFFAFSFISSKSPKNTNGKVTLAYWGLWEDSRVMQSIISDFQKQYPNITVNYSKQDPNQYRERLTTRIQNGTGPDVFRFHNTWYPVLSNILLPLPNDTIDKNDFNKWYYPVIQNDLVKNGAIYGIPLEIDTLSLFVNSDILKSAGVSAPKIWTELVDVARAVTVKDENGKIKTAGVALGTFDNISHASDIISLLLVQNGADLTKLSNTSKKTIDALNFFTSFALPDGGVWDNTLDPSILAFAKGNLAMFFGYSYDVFTIKAMSPNLNFQVVPVPNLSGRKTTIASYWTEGVSLKSRHQKEGLLFMKFLSQKETQQKLFSETSKTRLFGEPYSRTDLLETLKNNDMIYVFASQGKNAVSSFFSTSLKDDGFNSQFNKYLGDAVTAILSNTSAETALETLNSGVSQILTKYGQ